MSDEDTKHQDKIYQESTKTTKGSLALRDTVLEPDPYLGLFAGDRSQLSQCGGQEG